MDGEEGQLEAVGDSGLVVDGAQVVLDDLLFRAKLHGDVFIFAALDDEGYDLHLFGGEAVADAGAYGVGGLHGGDVGALEEALALADTANAVNEVVAGHTAT